jgi:hypothetical protein
MRAKLAVIALCALVLMANGANAQHRTSSQTHVRHLSHIFGQTYGNAPRQAPRDVYESNSQEIYDDPSCRDRGHAPVNDGHNNAVLQMHVARIDDVRLREAFQAAIGLRQISEPRQESAKSRRRKYRNLWKGLPQK